MPIANEIMRVEWRDPEIAIACDFDPQRRLAAVVKVPSTGTIAKINDESWPIPERWAPHIRKIKWLGTTEALLWPIVDRKTEQSSSVGKIGASGASIFKTGYPLDIFTDRSLVVCTLPEVLNVSDLISVYSYPELVKIARFSEPYSGERFSREMFLEVERAVVDRDTNYFWFTADATEHLWCFAVDTLEVAVGPLGCPRSKIVAIGCSGERASVIWQDSRGVLVRTYKKAGDAVVFETEEPLLFDNDLRRHFCRAVGAYAGHISGYVGNRFSLATPGRATLISF